jgi:hypothetical protein
MGQALVTGATSGIGRSIAIALRNAGYEVHAVGRRADALAAEYGVESVRVDVTDKKALAEALSSLDIHVLVDNAGVMPPLVNFCNLPEGDIDHAIAVNLSSVLFITRLVAPGMPLSSSRAHFLYRLDCWPRSFRKSRNLLCHEVRDLRLRAGVTARLGAVRGMIYRDRCRARRDRALPRATFCRSTCRNVRGELRCPAPRRRDRRRGHQRGTPYAQDSAFEMLRCLRTSAGARRRLGWNAADRCFDTPAY